MHAGAIAALTALRGAKIWQPQLNNMHCFIPAVAVSSALRTTHNLCTVWGAARLPLPHNTAQHSTQTLPLKQHESVGSNRVTCSAQHGHNNNVTWRRHKPVLNSDAGTPHTPTHCRRFCDQKPSTALRTETTLRATPRPKALLMEACYMIFLEPAARTIQHNILQGTGALGCVGVPRLKTQTHMHSPCTWPCNRCPRRHAVPAAGCTQPPPKPCSTTTLLNHCSRTPLSKLLVGTPTWHTHSLLLSHTQSIQHLLWAMCWPCWGCKTPGHTPCPKAVYPCCLTQ